MSTPIILPQIIVEAGLVPDGPVQTGTTLVLNDAVLGLLNTGTLGTTVTWSDISADVINFTITRPSTRLQGPLWNYQASTCSILIDNSSGNYDPDNLGGPYVIGGASQLIAMVPVRVRANFGSVNYSLYSGFADGWLPGVVSYQGDYAELTLAATDAFKVLAGINLAAVGITGAGALTGARVRDILIRANWYNSADKLLIDAGNSTLQGTTLGADALSLLQLAVDSEIGQLYVNGAGAVVFRARKALLTDTRSNTTQAVFGDKPDTLAPEAFPIGALNSNAGFSGTISPWSAANSSTLSYDTTYQYGTAPGTLAFHGNGSTANPQANSEDIPAVVGAQYTAFVATFSPTGADIQAKIDWLDSGHSFLSGTSFSVATDATAWNVLAPSGVAPASTAFARIAIQATGTPAVGVMFYVGYASAIAGLASASAVELTCAVIARANDDTTIVNDVQATRVSGALQEVTDSASIAKYLFPRTYSRTDLILQDDPSALNWAQWVLYIGKGGENRFESLQVDPQADAVNLWPQVLGRDIGDRIQIWTRPASLVTPVAKDCFIAGITHTFDAASSKWLTTWTLQDASKYGSFLTLNNPTLGKLNSNALVF